MKSTKMLKASAREMLLGNYSTAVITYALIQFSASLCLSFAESTLSRTLISILIYLAIYFVVALLKAVFLAGERKMYLSLARKEDFVMRDLLWALQGTADKAILIQFYILIQIILFGLPVLLCGIMIRLEAGKLYYVFLAVTFVLWVVSSIFVWIQFSQAFFFLVDYPQMSVKSLLEMSKEQMNGYKKKYFFLLLSFFGMFLIDLITFGVAAYWIHPYLTAAKTNFYLDLKSMAP